MPGYGHGHPEDIPSLAALAHAEPDASLPMPMPSALLRRDSTPPGFIGGEAAGVEPGGIPSWPPRPEPGVGDLQVGQSSRVSPGSRSWKVPPLCSVAQRMRARCMARAPGTAGHNGCRRHDAASRRGCKVHGVAETQPWGGSRGGEELDVGAVREDIGVAGVVQAVVDEHADVVDDRQAGVDDLVRAAEEAQCEGAGRDDVARG